MIARVLTTIATLAATPCAAQLASLPAGPGELATPAPPDAPTADHATQPREFTQAITPPPPAPPVTSAAKPFLFLAGESDIFEISSSQIALQRSQSPDVRRYAVMLIQHHTLTTNQALAAAKTAGMLPPTPVLQPDERDQITRLIAVDAAGFDREYLSQQVPAHEAALALHQAYAQSGDTPQLRTVAQGAVPIVTGHLEEARKLLGAKH
ncbi:DUF4142 domain-containing protein [Sphingomonas endolithica]|uniref:DUF4142 domain-containing protein n=1 Tax=Sphingomonas endolithica TaxID=2972485 RepID=UPI0021AEEB88|nr:DUF4142 domain-containing protein [Sphingomonas sp. ZFBP2030]